MDAGNGYKIEDGLSRPLLDLHDAGNASTRWPSVRYDDINAYCYSDWYGDIDHTYFCFAEHVPPISNSTL